MRAECPVAKVRLPMDVTGWFVTRHADVRELLADSRLSRPPVDGWPLDDDLAARPGGPQLITMMELEGPRHRALRAAVAEPFSVRSVRRLRSSMRQWADQLLDDFAANGQPGDLVTGFAEPFPLLVVCELVGIPYEDRHDFLGPADEALGAMLSQDRRQTVATWLREYLGNLLERKREVPGDDVLTALLRCCDSDELDEQGALDEEDVIAFGLSMLVAGYRTSTMFLANMVHTLLTRPVEFELLRRHRDGLSRAVEEMLRFLPVMNAPVVLLANEDIRLHDRTIPAGDAVVPAIASANRDEGVFPDAAELHLGRESTPHLAFGHGAHNCFGAHLARAELEIALDAVLDRFPQLRLVEGAQLEWDDTSPAKSPGRLPVNW